MNDDMQILGWDDEVEEGSPFVLLPEGNYPFTITGLEKGIYEKPANRESKIPANCPKATVTLEFTTSTGEKSTLTENFYLYKKMQWKINQFFTSIGAPKNPEGKVKMNWGTVLGAKGAASLVVNDYTDRSGNPAQNNRIKDFLEPTQQTAAPGYQAPQQNYQQPPAQTQPPQQNVTPFPQQTAAPQNGAGYNF
ncbi:hypothetical protein EFN91_09495 [Lactococcus lactis]|jgi:hypothetical protein|uniref:Phage protein n=1 Tax=Lactococcus lactis TaxID=1358 RepID=A0A943ZQ27_9LACT|nr:MULTISPECIES: hypothetical protein [Lactococcus]MBS7067436.1 hypothetical protein [Lactococcus lactis]MCT3101826.1 hypothetical protein [Lactococcus lactis]MDG4980310.1 hypothetical protein [Lactococcus lactis]DAG08695.1 MAG TPA: Protein of unknown function (DUF669) [Caudoviricetes sp.]